MISISVSEWYINSKTRQVRAKTNKNTTKKLSSHKDNLIFDIFIHIKIWSKFPFYFK